MLIYAALQSAIGPLHLVERAGKLCTLAFDDHWERSRELLLGRSGESLAPGEVGAVGAIEAYLRGDLRAIDELEVDLDGTEFQRRVWAELRKIGCGATTTYGAIARTLGQPSAMRAVGAANGQNPVAIVVPCHRVIGADGTLTGYGGGIDRKRWLLELEGVLQPELFAAITPSPAGPRRGSAGRASHRAR